jgi:hypothetical protein
MLEKRAMGIRVGAGRVCVQGNLSSRPPGKEWERKTPVEVLFLPNL